MADKDTRIEQERLGRPVDELVTGRALGAGDRPGDYTTAEIAGQATAGSSGATAAPGKRRAQGTKSDRDREPNADLHARALREEIEATREDMSETVNAIQDRLRPGTIASNAADSLRDAAADTTRDIVESEPVQYVRANPVPTAMVGIGLAGLAWLAFGGRDADEHRRGRSRARLGGPYYDDVGARASGRSDYGAYGSYGRESDEGLTARVADLAGDARERAGEMAGDARERAGEIANDVRRRAEGATRQARQQASRARSSLQRAWNENPLIVGAASAVLGALAGLAVPETEAENQWMGERRDQMIEGVQEAVREKVDEVQHAATDAADQVKKAVGIEAEG